MILHEEKWFQRIMQSEGGLNLKEPASVGGKSYAGISQKTYKKWRQDKCKIGHAPFEVEELAANAIGTEYEKQNPFTIPNNLGVQSDIIEAFYTDYFKMARLEILPECLKYIHADFFVNAGFSANKILQRMVGFTKPEDVDGRLGPASRQKISELKSKIEADLIDDSTADDDAIIAYHNLKLEHYEAIADKNIKLYNTNIKGWRKRSQHILSDLGEYFVDEEPTTSAVLDESDHESVFENPEEVDHIDNFSQDMSRSREEIIKDITGAILKELISEIPKYIEKALQKK